MSKSFLIYTGVVVLSILHGVLSDGSVLALLLFFGLMGGWIGAMEWLWENRR